MTDRPKFSKPGSKLAYEIEKSVYREKKLRAKQGLGMGKEEFKRRLQKDLNRRKTGRR